MGGCISATGSATSNGAVKQKVGKAEL
jgi:hypothetical protein